jgi:hypothetical protein
MSSRETIISYAGQSSVTRDNHPLRGTIIRYAGQSSVTRDNHPLRGTIIRYIRHVRYIPYVGQSLES